MAKAANPRKLVIRFLFIACTLVILGRLFSLQIVDDRYKILANDLAIYRKVVYPPRGVIVDRNNQVLLYNQVVYDLNVAPHSVTEDLDTTTLCEVLGITRQQFEEKLRRVRIRTGPMRKGPLIEELSPAQSARFQENMYLFPEFELGERFIRTYPNSSGAQILGYIGEVSARMLERDRYQTYQQGDYTGMTGLELTYEEVLRGQRGVYFLERDNFNRPREPYKNGALDTQAIAGRSLELYLDASLQQYAEKLMANKIGSVVAIDPSTGGILTLVSAPTYDPNLLKGKERSAHFAQLFRDPTHPLFNRAIQASYQPGSTIKPITALIALDVGVITDRFGISCGGGYYACQRRIGCTHSGGGHAANLRLAIANSCNSYFVHLFRLIVDAPKFGGVKKGTQAWAEYCHDFGFGQPTGVDLPYEGSGLLPDSNTYNRMYHGSWNSCTNLFVGMGQGELALTPLQLANAMCIIANKGYYYTPHFVKSIGGNPDDSLLARFKQKQVATRIPDSLYDIVGLGMMDVVEKGTGKVARIPNIEVCAKTGTVENKAMIRGRAVKMKDHSVFVAYAPRENPRIAIAVIVENAGYGSAWAGPIASLIIEKYLTDSIRQERKPLEEKILNAYLINQYVQVIDSAQRAKDLERWELKQARIRREDSLQRRQDSIRILRWLENTYLKKGERG